VAAKPGLGNAGTLGPDSLPWPASAGGIANHEVRVDRREFLLNSAWAVAASAGFGAKGAQPGSTRGSGGGSATGPLRMHPDNPRYFADGSGNPVWLTGSHTWGNLQDYTYDKLPSPPPMDFAAYLAFLRRHGHNFIRLWTWESAYNPGAQQGTIRYGPMPYERTGPGLALDGKPRFDLTRFHEPYFRRLRTRVAAARDRGVYVAVMLFQGFSLEGKGNVGGDPWQGHPMNPRNNMNGIDGGGVALHTLTKPTVTRIQEAYIRKVVDTVNDLDNVLYEVTNEDAGGAANTAWQEHVVRVVKRYEATKPKQHPVGMTAQWPGGDDAALFRGPADWVSPATRFPQGDAARVVLNDTDHSYFWTDLKRDGPDAQRAWVWKNLTRGQQCLFMDPYLDPSHDPGRNNPSGRTPDSYWDALRDAMGRARACAMRMDLAHAAPRSDLASSGFCLACAGSEYLVYLPDGGEVTVDLSDARGELAVEWARPAGAPPTRGGTVPGGDVRKLSVERGSDAVLYLRRTT